MAEGQSKWKHKFYDDVEPIKLYDPLANFLGAIEEREPFVFSYSDTVKLAGHSCPTVAGAYKITQKALTSLYKDKMPVRGDIKVTVLASSTDGSNGPMAQVISFITGAAGETGFNGLGGKFVRANKLIFDTKNEEFGAFIFEREDTGEKVKIKYNPQLLPQPENMSEYFMKCLSGKARAEDKEIFGDMWHEKVKKVLFEEVDGLFEVILLQNNKKEVKLWR